MAQARGLAKKVFFLYPHSVFQEQLLHILVQAEFEVAVIPDHQHLMPLLHKYPESIVFINIESSVMKPKEWESFVRMIQDTKDRHKALVGIITYNPDKEVAEKYLMELGVPCGFVGLKLGVPETTRILLKTLEANEARGDRRYVRVKCNPNKTGMSIGLGSRLLAGELLDVSSAGCSCVLGNKIPIGTNLPDIQLKLWGALVKVSGTVLGTRTLDDDHEIHVLMFDETLDRNSKAKIYTFIQKSLQAEVDALF